VKGKISAMSITPVGKDDVTERIRKFISISVVTIRLLVGVVRGVRVVRLHLHLVVGYIRLLHDVNRCRLHNNNGLLLNKHDRLRFHPIRLSLHRLLHGVVLSLDLAGYYLSLLIILGSVRVFKFGGRIVIVPISNNYWLIIVGSAYFTQFYSFFVWRDDVEKILIDSILGFTCSITADELDLPEIVLSFGDQPYRRPGFYLFHSVFHQHFVSCGNHVTSLILTGNNFTNLSARCPTPNISSTSAADSVHPRHQGHEARN
jgi:hypothetical protein